jgi:GNAT superfamily N-acetyltransferase
MEIAGLTASQHADYLALVNAEIRPPGSATHPWEDFPLALDLANVGWMLGATDADGRLAGGLAILVRPFATSCGDIEVGAVGSVVTRPDCRGRGLSARLQSAAVASLRRQNVPLAALWTDRPEIYAGRGFIPAGWEWHAGLEAATLADVAPTGVTLRNWRREDSRACERLYEGHRWRTVRQPGDAARLYGMPGTRGLVAEAGGEVRAAIFCGKGADFPEYVAEWSGDPDLVLALLGLARARGLAGAVLIPAGGEALAERLAAAGAPPLAMTSGCWAVVRPDLLAARLTASGIAPPPAAADARGWIGTVAGDGSVTPGPLTLAVWGFDSA